MRTVPVLIALLILLPLAAPAPACLNDSSSASGEHEFVSRYSLDPRNPQSGWNWVGLGVAFAAAVMVGACIAVAITGKPRRAP